MLKLKNINKKYFFLEFFSKYNIEFFWHTPTTKVAGFLAQTQLPQTQVVRWSYHCLPIRRCPYEVSFQQHEHHGRGFVRIADIPKSFRSNWDYLSCIRSHTTCLMETICQSYAQCSHTWLQLAQGYYRIRSDPSHSFSFPISETFRWDSSPQWISYRISYRGRELTSTGNHVFCLRHTHKTCKGQALIAPYGVILWHNESAYVKFSWVS